MKHYETPTYPAGLRLPYSGFIIGRLAEALRLKTMLREDFEAVSYKTVQRYFSGDRIEPGSVDQILDALVESLVPNELTLGNGFIDAFPVGLVVRSALRDYARHWDRMAASANVHMFDVTNHSDLPMPALRLVALDLGIRIGGWAAIQYLKDAPISWETTWLDGGELGRFIDQRRKKLGFPISTLAERVGVSVQAVDAWLSGSSLPTSNNIEALANAIAGDDLRRSEVEYMVRVLVAIEQVIADLKGVIGEHRLEDLVQGIKSTGREVENFQRKMLSVDPPPDLPLPMMFKWSDMLLTIKRQMLRGALWELPVYGARCGIGQSTAIGLAEQAKYRPQAAADFAVLSGDWSPRITYWMSHVGSTVRATEFLRDHLPAKTGCPPEQVEMIVEAVVDGTLALGDLFWQPPPDTVWTVISPPPLGKAMNRLSQAGLAGSTGDFETAVEHLRYAVRHQPKDASVHLALGSALWQAGLEYRDITMVEEGLVECRIAVQLDPEFGNARNEIGVILSNLRRHEEAEEAFAEAEPYQRQHNHHWFCRGTNYLALGRLEDASAAFARTIALTPQHEHVEAKARLAATLMALGRKRDARNLAKQVAHVLGVDPTADWQARIDPWSRQIWPPSSARSHADREKRAKVGRNESCPCGSGAKFKRCCGR